MKNNQFFFSWLKRRHFWNNGTTSSEPVDGKFQLDGLTWIGASRIVLRNPVRVSKHVLGGFTHHTLSGFPQKNGKNGHVISFFFSFCLFSLFSNHFQLDDCKSLHKKWLEITKHPLSNGCLVLGYQVVL